MSSLHMLAYLYVAVYFCSKIVKFLKNHRNEKKNAQKSINVHVTQYTKRREKEHKIQFTHVA